MSNDKPVQLGFKSYAPSEWPMYLSNFVRKMHEHIRVRGFTAEEVRLFKASGRWMKGEYVEKASPKGPFVT